MTTTRTTSRDRVLYQENGNVTVRVNRKTMSSSLRTFLRPCFSIQEFEQSRRPMLYERMSFRVYENVLRKLS